MMKIIYSYVFTQKEYEVPSDQHLADIFGFPLDSVAGACEFAKKNNGVCYTRLDPYSLDLMKRKVLVFASTAEELETLIQLRYNLVLKDTYKSTGNQQ